MLTRVGSEIKLGSIWALARERISTGVAGAQKGSVS